MARDDLGWSSLIGMGATTAMVLVLGGAAGWFVDRLVSTSPVFLLIGLALGIAGAVVYMITQFRKYLSD